MALSVPTRAPLSVPLLSRLDFERNYPEFDDTWSLSLHLNGPGAGDGIDVAAVVTGSTFRFTTPTDGLDLGRYDWQVWAEHATAGRRVAESGTLEIVPGFLEGAFDDGTSTHSQRMIELIEARLEGRLPLDAESYSIGGRSLSRIPIRELRELRADYKIERAAELAALEAGQRPGRKLPVKVGF